MGAPVQDRDQGHRLTKLCGVVSVGSVRYTTKPKRKGQALSKLTRSHSSPSRGLPCVRNRHSANSGNVGAPEAIAVERPAISEQSTGTAFAPLRDKGIRYIEWTRNANTDGLARRRAYCSTDPAPPLSRLVTARRDNYFRSWARPHKVCISPATFRKKGHLIHCKPASRARNSPCHDRHPYAVLLRRIAASSALIPKPGERRSHVPLY